MKLSLEDTRFASPATDKKASHEDPGVVIYRRFSPRCHFLVRPSQKGGKYDRFLRGFMLSSGDFCYDNKVGLGEGWVIPKVEVDSLLRALRSNDIPFIYPYTPKDKRAGRPRSYAVLIKEFKTYATKYQNDPSSSEYSGSSEYVQALIISDWIKNSYSSTEEVDHERLLSALRFFMDADAKAKARSEIKAMTKAREKAGAKDRAESMAKKGAKLKIIFEAESEYKAKVEAKAKITSLPAEISSVGIPYVGVPSSGSPTTSSPIKCYYTSQTYLEMVALAIYDVSEDGRKFASIQSIKEYALSKFNVLTNVYDISVAIYKGRKNGHFKIHTGHIRSFKITPQGKKSLLGI